MTTPDEDLALAAASGEGAAFAPRGFRQGSRRRWRRLKRIGFLRLRFKRSESKLLEVPVLEGTEAVPLMRLAQSLSER